MTSAGDIPLPMRRVVHATAPDMRLQGQAADAPRILRAAALAAFRAAYGAGSLHLAFPAIGTGLFRCPVGVFAAATADAWREFAGDRVSRDRPFAVSFTVFGEAAEALRGSLEAACPDPQQPGGGAAGGPTRPAPGGAGGAGGASGGARGPGGPLPGGSGRGELEDEVPAPPPPREPPQLREAAGRTSWSIAPEPPASALVLSADPPPPPDPVDRVRVVPGVWEEMCAKRRWCLPVPAGSVVQPRAAAGQWPDQALPGIAAHVIGASVLLVGMTVANPAAAPLAVAVASCMVLLAAAAADGWGPGCICAPAWPPAQSPAPKPGTTRIERASPWAQAWRAALREWPGRGWTVELYDPGLPSAVRRPARPTPRAFPPRAFGTRTFRIPWPTSLQSRHPAFVARERWRAARSALRVEAAGCEVVVVDAVRTWVPPLLIIADTSWRPEGGRVVVWVDSGALWPRPVAPPAQLPPPVPAGTTYSLRVCPAGTGCGRCAWADALFWAAGFSPEGAQSASAASVVRLGVAHREAPGWQFHQKPPAEGGLEVDSIAAEEEPRADLAAAAQLILRTTAEAPPPPQGSLPVPEEQVTDAAGAVRVAWVSEDRPRCRTTSPLPAKARVAILTEVLVGVAAGHLWPVLASFVLASHLIFGVHQGDAVRACVDMGALSAMAMASTVQYASPWALACAGMAASAKADAKCAFKIIPLALEDARYACIEVADVCLAALVVQFGYTSGPRWWVDRLTAVMAALADPVVLVVAAFIAYMDDVGIAALTVTWTMHAVLSLLVWWLTCGVWPSASKCFWRPAMALRFLGLVANLRRRTLAVAPSAVERVLPLARTIAEAEPAEPVPKDLKATARRLVGRLTHMAEALPALALTRTSIAKATGEPAPGSDRDPSRLTSRAVAEAGALVEWLPTIAGVVADRSVGLPLLVVVFDASGPTAGGAFWMMFGEGWSVIDAAPICLKAAGFDTRLIQGSATFECACLIAAMRMAAARCSRRWRACVAVGDPRALCQAVTSQDAVAAPRWRAKSAALAVLVFQLWVETVWRGVARWFVLAWHRRSAALAQVADAYSEAVAHMWAVGAVCRRMVEAIAGDLQADLAARDASVAMAPAWAVAGGDAGRGALMAKVHAALRGADGDVSQYPAPQGTLRLAAFRDVVAVLAGPTLARAWLGWLGEQAREAMATRVWTLIPLAMRPWREAAFALRGRRVAEAWAVGHPEDRLVEAPDGHRPWRQWVLAAWASPGSPPPGTRVPGGEAGRPAPPNLQVAPLQTGAGQAARWPLPRVRLPLARPSEEAAQGWMEVRTFLTSVAALPMMAGSGAEAAASPVRPPEAVEEEAREEVASDSEAESVLSMMSEATRRFAGAAVVAGASVVLADGRRLVLPRGGVFVSQEGQVTPWAECVRILKEAESDEESEEEEDSEAEAASERLVDDASESSQVASSSSDGDPGARLRARAHAASGRAAAEAVAQPCRKRRRRTPPWERRGRVERRRQAAAWDARLRESPPSSGTDDVGSSDVSESSSSSASPEPRAGAPRRQQRPLQRMWAAARRRPQPAAEAAGAAAPAREAGHPQVIDLAASPSSAESPSPRHPAAAGRAGRSPAPDPEARAAPRERDEDSSAERRAVAALRARLRAREEAAIRWREPARAPARPPWQAVRPAAAVWTPPPAAEVQPAVAVEVVAHAQWAGEEEEPEGRGDDGSEDGGPAERGGERTGEQHPREATGATGAGDSDSYAGRPATWKLWAQATLWAWAAALAWTAGCPRLAAGPPAPGRPVWRWRLRAWLRQEGGGRRRQRRRGPRWRRRQRRGLRAAQAASAQAVWRMVKVFWILSCAVVADLEERRRTSGLGTEAEIAWVRGGRNPGAGPEPTRKRLRGPPAASRRAATVRLQPDAPFLPSIVGKGMRAAAAAAAGVPEPQPPLPPASEAAGAAAPGRASASAGEAAAAGSSTSSAGRSWAPTLCRDCLAPIAVDDDARLCDASGCDGWQVCRACAPTHLDSTRLLCPGHQVGRIPLEALPEGDLLPRTKVGTVGRLLARLIRRCAGASAVDLAAWPVSHIPPESEEGWLPVLRETADAVADELWTKTRRDKVRTSARQMAALAADRGCLDAPLSEIDDFALMYAQRRLNAPMPGWRSVLPSSVARELSSVAEAARIERVPGRVPPYLSPRASRYLATRGAFERADHTRAWPVTLRSLWLARGSCPPQHADALHAAMLQSLFCLRAGGVPQLRWKDLTPCGRGMALRWSRKTKVKRGDRLAKADDKASAVQQFSAAAGPVLREVLAYAKARAGRRPSPDDKIFPDVTAAKVTAMLRAVLPPVPEGFRLTAHAVRAGSATVLTAMDMPLDAIRAMGWWSRERHMEGYYASLSINVMMAASERMHLVHLEPECPGYTRVISIGGPPIDWAAAKGSDEPIDPAILRPKEGDTTVDLDDESSSDDDDEAGAVLSARVCGPAKQGGRPLARRRRLPAAGD